MKKNSYTIIYLACFALIICAAILLIPRLFNGGQTRVSNGVVVYDRIELSAPLFPSAPGNLITENKFASIDFSNASRGYISVRYKGGSLDEPIIKIRYGEYEYVYLLGSEDFFPLTYGNGNYSVEIFQRQKGGKYKAVMKKNLAVELENQLLPYLYPSQMVNYTDSSIAILYSNELCRGIESDLDKLRVIYDFIIENIEYDFIKAANVEAGYIPSIDSTYITKSGICFDYSVMMAAMLRSQMIPTKLVMGYLHGTSIFHAWNEVYLNDKGWVTVSIFVDSLTFRMLDTTLAASQSDEKIAQKLDDPEVYLPVFRY